jgi:hypothetical protein
MRRLIVANFDCELRFAQESSPGPHKDLPQKVRLALSRAAPALAVFGDESTDIWTMAANPASAGGRERSGPFSALPAYEAILPWGQSSDLPWPQQSQGPSPQASWQERLWWLRAEAGSAARCNDRRFALGLDLSPEWTLPEREVVSSMESLDEYIGTRTLGPDDTWVAKAPWSASGRERVRRRGRRLEGEVRVRSARLLKRYGALVIEPWMPREADYGVAGVIGLSIESTMLFAPHQLHSDDTGVYRGIRIADQASTSKLGSSFAKALAETAESVATALHGAGYRGPFGIDAFVYKDRSQQTRLQALCEVNARLCFGLVARAQAEKLGLSAFDFSF